MRKPQDPISAARWLDVRNTATETAPAHGLLRITGVDSDGTITVGKPDADGQTTILVNGPVAIPAGEYGQAHNSSPCAVLYDSGDGTPAAGETWGAASSSWKARKSKAGGRVLSAGNTSTALVNLNHAWGALGAPLRKIEYLDTPYTPPDNSWGDTGLSIVLPIVGTYLIVANSTGELATASNATAAFEYAEIRTRLYNVTRSLTVDYSTCYVVSVEQDGNGAQQTASVSLLYTSQQASEEIRMEAYLYTSGGTVNTKTLHGPGSEGVTTILYVLLP